MLNFFDDIIKNPETFKQIVFDDVIFAEYTCPLPPGKTPLWSPNHYLIYITKGRKIWHTPYGSWDLREGDCVLIKHGACIVEQFFDPDFCFVIFFISDQFIKNTLEEYRWKNAEETSEAVNKPIFPVSANDRLKAFIQSMGPYFSFVTSHDKPLVMLKFKELILHLTNERENKEIAQFFHHVSRRVKPSVEEVMESNFCYNLSLEDYARLSCRSISTFKRDFKSTYGTSLTRWLRERRLNFAKVLLANSDKSVTDVQLETGFENLSHFSKVFKDQFGVSPNRYRERVLQPSENSNIVN